MSGEQVLPLPLSGAEVIKKILYDIERSLKRDCFLNENAAYETVQGVIGIRLALKDCGRECIVERSVEVAQGPHIDESDPDVYLAQADMTFEPEPPNVVRQQTEQPLPVLVEDSTGKREVKRVTYAKPQRSRALRPDQAVARGAERAQGGVVDADLPPAGPEPGVPAAVPGPAPKTVPETATGTVDEVL